MKSSSLTFSTLAAPEPESYPCGLPSERRTWGQRGLAKDSPARTSLPADASSERAPRSQDSSPGLVTAEGEPRGRHRET